MAQMAQMIAKALARTEELFDKTARQNEVDATSNSYTGGSIVATPFIPKIEKTNTQPKLTSTGWRMSFMTNLMLWAFALPRGCTKHSNNDDTFVFRLEPTATVNDHWFLWARIDAKTNMRYDDHAQKDLQTKIFAGRFNADTTGGDTRGYYYLRRRGVGSYGQCRRDLLP